MDRGSRKPRKRRGLLKPVWVLGGLFLVAGPVLRGQSPEGSPIAGARRYQEYCAACHGVDSKGGDKAASLVTVESVGGRTESDLFRIVHDGTPEGMPPFAQIGDANIAAVVHYLRLLAESSLPRGTVAVPMTGGNANAGRALYFGSAQCSACHMFGGQGGFAAMNLTDYARNRTAETVRKAIVEPSEETAPIVRLASATTKDGQILTGLVRSEDAFTLTLQTEDGRFHFLDRKNLAIVQDAGQLLMPRDYSTLLTAEELNNLVSFLVASRELQNSESGPSR